MTPLRACRHCQTSQIMEPAKVLPVESPEHDGPELAEPLLLQVTGTL